tara:strand:- start:177424 stop:178224 length:801 start_codon:yes stop_codon:yes gene_type:complete
MDAVKVLGALLGQRSGRSGNAGNVLGQVLNGIAAAKEQHDQQGHRDPRFDHRHHTPLEQIVRDSVSRHHRSGGHLPSSATQWMERNRGYDPRGYGTPGFDPRGRNPRAHDSHRHDSHRHGSQPPTVRSVPRPRHDVDDDHDHRHGSGLGYHQRAELLITAMIMAAQADGKLDEAEQDRIVQQLQPLDRDESDFLRREFRRRHDVHDFVHSVPNGMEYEIYQVTLMAIDLDTQHEANYLRELVKCLRIDPQVCNQMHRRYNAPTLFR